MDRQPLFIKEIDMKMFDHNADFAAELAIFKNFKALPLSNPLTFFVGENGSGKSTLLEGVAINFGFSSEGGSLNYNLSVNQTSSNLWQYLRLAKSGTIPTDSFFLHAESFQNMSNYTDDIVVDKGEFGGKPLHHQSHGESFFNLIKYRFKGNGLYLLDEPEAALSPQMQLSLMVVINNLLQTGAQFIIATHSPILLSMPNASILSFTEAGIQEISYEETSSYQITKMLFENREGLLEELLNEKD